MEEAEKAICSAYTKHGAQARISSEQHQTREPRVSISKRGVEMRCSAMRGPRLFSKTRDPRLYTKTQSSWSLHFWSFTSQTRGPRFFL